MRPSKIILPFLMLALALPAAAETFVFPHLLEQTGSVALDRSPGSSDNIIQLTNPAALVSGGGADTGNYATVFFFTATGAPMAGPFGDICNPCTIEMGTAAIADMSLIEVIVAAAIQAPDLEDGYIVIETFGPDDLDVSVETEVYLDSGRTTSVVTPLRVPCGGTGGGQSSGARTFVFPHLLESSGSVLADPDALDTTINMVYQTDLDPADPAFGTDVELYIFDQRTGAPLTDDMGTAICAPCNFPMSSSITPRKRAINVGTLLTSHGGGFPTPTVDAVAVAVATGDVDGLSMSSTTLQSRNGPGDLSVFVFEPQAIAAAAAVSVEELARPYLDLRSHPNPFNPKTTLSFTLDREDRATLRIVDVKGRAVRTLSTGRLPAGDHAIAWDGRSDDGKAAPAGVYLAWLETSTYATVEKLALVK